MKLKPKYVSWRNWIWWLLLPRYEKQELENIVRVREILHPLLRNHPEVVQKIQQGQSCSWDISDQDTSDTIEAVKRMCEDTP